MGSMNFGLYPMLERYKDFKHDWERPYLEGSRDRIFRNTFADIEYVLTTCAENGTRFEIECYDIGHLYTLAHFVERGLVKPPLFVQTVFGILGGIGTASGGRAAHAPHGRPAVRRAITAGRCSPPGATRCRSRPWPRRWAATSASGSRIRSGSAPGQLATLERRAGAPIRGIIEGLGLEIATPRRGPRDPRLKGGDRVAF